MPSLPSSPRLRRIVLAYAVNELGTWFGYVALSVSVYDHTHNAFAVAGFFLAARLLPALLTPPLVASIELSDRRGGLSRLYAVEAVAALILALLLSDFWLPAVLLLVTIDGTAALAANALLRTAAARAAVEEVDAEGREGSSEESEDHGIENAQREANAAMNVAFTVTVALGPAIAGVFVTVAGGPAALLVDAVSFVGCSILLLDVRSLVEATEEGSLRARLATAWRHLRAVPQLGGLLIIEGVALVLFFSVEPVEVLYAKASLNAGDLGFGLLVGAWGAGMVLGGIVFARSVRRPLGPMLTTGTLLIGLAYIGMGAAPTLAIACAIAFVGGAGNGVQWPSFISAVQSLTPSVLQGRIMSAVSSVSALCPALGFVLGGTLAAVSSPRTALVIAGVAASLLPLPFLRVSTQSFSTSTKPISEP